MSATAKEEILPQIVEIVHACGEIMLSATDIQRKTHLKTGKGNFVTEYDSKVQAVLKDRLLTLVPEAAFLGEEDEMDHTDISRGYAFIVDPIDGTANFTRGCKASCISVALAQDGVPILGVIYDPYRGETYHAQKGMGAFLNGEPIHASKRPLAEGIILFGTSPYYPELKRKAFEIAFRYMSCGEDLRRSGSAALDLCMIASGRAEFFFELVLSPWDYAAGALLVEEAGGIVSDLKGASLTYDRKQTVTARGPKVELLEEIPKHRRHYMNCIKCGAELTSEMFAYGMCFSCGSSISGAEEAFKSGPSGIKAEALLAVRQQKEAHMLTTGFSFEGYRITGYLGIVTGETIMGTGCFADLGASVSDLFGTEASGYSEKLRITKQAVLDLMIKDSIDRGGNAVIGISYGFMTFSGNMMGVSVTGTSVKVEKLSGPV